MNKKEKKKKRSKKRSLMHTWASEVAEHTHLVQILFDKLPDATIQTLYQLRTWFQEICSYWGTFQFVAHYLNSRESLEKYDCCYDCVVAFDCIQVGIIEIIIYM